MYRMNEDSIQKIINRRQDAQVVGFAASKESRDDPYDELIRFQSLVSRDV